MASCTLPPWRAWRWILRPSKKTWWVIIYASERELRGKMDGCSPVPVLRTFQTRRFRNPTHQIFLNTTRCIDCAQKLEIHERSNTVRNDRRQCYICFFSQNPLSSTTTAKNIFFKQLIKQTTIDTMHGSSCVRTSSVTFCVHSD